MTSSTIPTEWSKQSARDAGLVTTGLTGASTKWRRETEAEPQRAADSPSFLTQPGVTLGHHPPFIMRRSRARPLTLESLNPTQVLAWM